jgi:uncharacterized membrane protein YjdF
MFIGSLFYGDYLVSRGLPCDTNPFGVSLCLFVLAFFWIGVVFVGTGFTATFYLKIHRHAQVQGGIRSRALKGGEEPPSRLRAFLRFWVTPVRPLDPSRLYPLRISVNIPIFLGLVFLEWWYFYAEVPYDTIPNKPFFWLALFGWLVGPVIFEIANRNASTRQMHDKVADYFIGLGLVGIALSILSRGNASLIPAVAAAVPGFLAGAFLGAIFELVFRYHKGQGGVKW